MKCSLIKTFSNLETYLLDPNMDDTIEFTTNVVNLSSFEILKKYLDMN